MPSFPRESHDDSQADIRIGGGVHIPMVANIGIREGKKFNVPEVDVRRQYVNPSIVRILGEIIVASTEVISVTFPGINNSIPLSSVRIGRSRKDMIQSKIPSHQLEHLECPKASGSSKDCIGS